MPAKRKLFAPPTSPDTPTASTARHPAPPKHPRSSDIGWVADENAAFLAEDKRLNAAAYRQRWHLAMKRKATSRDVLQLSTRLDLKNLQGLVLYIGSQDAKDLEASQDITAQETNIREIIDNYNSALTSITAEMREDAKIVFILPFPNPSVTETTLDRLKFELRSVLEQFVNIQTLDIGLGWQFKDFVNSCIDQQSNLILDNSLLLLEETAKLLGVPNLTRSSTITCMELFRGRCFRCGLSHTPLGPAGCKLSKVSCTLCGANSHASTVCRSIATMCSTCGGRSHAEATCVSNLL